MMINSVLISVLNGISAILAGTIIFKNLAAVFNANAAVGE